MAAGPTAAVVLYVLAPEKMIGWPSAPRPNEREFILPAVRDLPELGRLTGRGDTANVEVVLKAKPDLIFDFGSVIADLSSRWPSRVQEQTGIPYLLLDGRLDRTRRHRAPARRGARRRASAPSRSPRYVEDDRALIDERLADLPAAQRHRVYLAREAERARDRAHRLDQHRDHRAGRGHQRGRARQPGAAASPTCRSSR